MKLLKDKKKVIKSYSFLYMAANFLIALSVSGLSVLAVLSFLVLSIRVSTKKLVSN